MERKEVKTTVCQALVASLLFSPVLVFAGSEAKNADQLSNKLLKAAQTGNVENFLSGLTMESRKRVVAAYASQASILKIQETFQDALNQRFGQGAEVLTSPPDGLKAAIGHLASSEVISQTPRSDGCVELEVKTMLKMENEQTVSRPDTLLVCQEEGSWKLSLGFAADVEYPFTALRGEAIFKLTCRWNAVEMIDGQADGDGLFADTLIANLTEQTIGAEVESSTAFGNRHHVGAKPVAPFRLAEETGFPPDDIGSKRSLSGVVSQVQSGRVQEPPEHGFIPQQSVAGMAGALAGVRLPALLQGDAKVVAGGE